MKVALVAARVTFAVGVTLALVAGLSARMNQALAADTPEVQQKKASGFIETRRQRAGSKSAGCVFGKLVTAGVDKTGLLLIIFCTASNEYIFAGARNELKQDILTIGLAAMSSGKHIMAEVADGMVIGFAITEFPIDDR